VPYRSFSWCMKHWWQASTPTFPFAVPIIRDAVWGDQSLPHQSVCIRALKPGQLPPSSFPPTFRCEIYETSEAWLR